MQTYSQLEHEMHNSPLKCTTNDYSPDKEIMSPKIQAAAYRNSDEKAAAAFVRESPQKSSMQKSSPQCSPSPVKTKNSFAENREDPSYRSPP
jgi:hypothetical protein